VPEALQVIATRDSILLSTQLLLLVVVVGLSILATLRGLEVPAVLVLREILLEVLATLVVIHPLREITVDLVPVMPVVAVVAQVRLVKMPLLILVATVVLERRHP
jgi:hypothetical protein